MRIGVVFPQTGLGGDAGAVRAWARRAEELGFTHVLAYDHVADWDKLAAAMRQWQDAGATHLSVNTMGAGRKTVDDHLAALATAAEAAKTISG